MIQNNRGKGRLKYLLQQTELFAHFAKGDQSSQKKSKGRYIYIPKITTIMLCGNTDMSFFCYCSELIRFTIHITS